MLERCLLAMVLLGSVAVGANERRDSFREGLNTQSMSRVLNVAVSDDDLDGSAGTRFGTPPTGKRWGNPGMSISRSFSVSDLNGCGADCLFNLDKIDIKWLQACIQSPKSVSFLVSVVDCADVVNHLSAVYNSLDRYRKNWKNSIRGGVCIPIKGGYENSYELGFLVFFPRKNLFESKYKKDFYDALKELNQKSVICFKDGTAFEMSTQEKTFENVLGWFSGGTLSLGEFNSPGTGFTIFELPKGNTTLVMIQGEGKESKPIQLTTFLDDLGEENTNSDQENQQEVDALRGQIVLCQIPQSTPY